MGSSRLPGKVLIEVNGTPLLGHLLDRLSGCSSLDKLVVATTHLAEDDPIKQCCEGRNVACYRGSPPDVLERLTIAFTSHGADIGVTVYGDGPLIDPAIVDQAVELYQSYGTFDFVGNDLKTTYPGGMEVEVFSIESLQRADTMCNDFDVREHGTLFLRQHPEIFRIHNFEAQHPLRRPDLSLEVDAPEDLALIEQIMQHFINTASYSLSEIIEFVDAKKIHELNKNIPRRWKKYRLQ
jgi:spore coat polysaccharide biosynthesis protein SpsF (cytidylyltransferase family)